MEYLLTDAEYFDKMQMDAANFPRGQTTYHIDDVEEDITINTVVEMDGTPMLESKLNDIITTIYMRSIYYWLQTLRRLILSRSIPIRLG